MNRFIVLWICLLYSGLGRASDIAVVTLAVGTEYKECVKLGIQNKRLYCEKHGYDFICIEESLDLSRPISWSKILLVQKIMENPKYKWVFWTDADSLVMNLGIPLEHFIDDNYNMVVGEDFNGVNLGQFFLKNCPWSHQLLAIIYAHTECMDHIWWEQKAFMLVLEKDPELFPFVKRVPHRLFNSYAEETVGLMPDSTYQRGDFMIHFASVHVLETITSLFQKYSAYVFDDPHYPPLP